MKTKLLLPVFLLAYAITYQAKAQTNVAIGKTATSSSLENGDQFATRFAIDGLGTGSQINTTSGACTGSCSRWSSAFSDIQWYCINLGTVHSIDSVKLYWEASKGKDFTIQTSPDSTNWTVIKTVTGNTSPVNKFSFTGATGKYIRMYGTARSSQYGYSLWEFEVYGTTATILPIRITNFSAQLNNKATLINWQAFTDKPATFTIERSSDAFHFYTIGSLTLSPGNSSIVTGNFTDASPLAGSNLYRLQMQEAGNTSNIYSKIVEVNNGRSVLLSVYPNPIKSNFINIHFNQLTSGKIEVKLRAISGVLITSQAVVLNNTSQYPVNLQNKLVPGVYWLDVMQNGTVSHLKVVAN